MPKNLKWVALGTAVFFTIFSIWGIYDVFFKVPNFAQLKESVQVPIRLANGDKGMRTVGPKTAHWTPLSGMAEYLPRAVVASEDASFYSHKGIDVFEMQEAFKKDLKEGRFARGASTITQQVLKNVYLSHHFKIWRKVKEIAWASKLEAVLSKPQILAFYLNMAEWGPGIYGVGEASRQYFATSPSGLTPRQAAFLAMMLPSPRRYHSFFKKRQLTEWASKRVNRILTVMQKMGQIDEAQYDLALNERLWDSDVLADNAPGAPTDPGWDVSESEYEQFEPVVGKLPTQPLAKGAPGTTPPAANVPAEAVVAPSTETIPMDNPLAESPMEPLPGQKQLNSVEPEAVEKKLDSVDAPAEVPTPQPTEAAAPATPEPAPAQ